MRNHKAALVFALSLPLISAGCAAFLGAAAGAAVVFGVIKYQDNQAEVHYERPMTEVFEASVQGLIDAGYKDARQFAEKSGREGSIKVGNVEVGVSLRSETTTRVRVRVGTFESDEHKAEAERILNAIAARLGV